MLFHDAASGARWIRRRSLTRRTCLTVSIIAGLLTFNAGAYGKATIFECSGPQRAYNPVTKEKMPATTYTRTFKFDDDQNSIFEYLDNKWAILDPDAEVDKTDISARYSRDYADASGKI